MKLTLTKIKKYYRSMSHYYFIWTNLVKCITILEPCCKVLPHLLIYINFYILIEFECYE